MSEDRLIFTIEICQCLQDGKLFLTVPTEDGSGVRITGHKSAGGKVIKTLRASIRQKDLDAACRFAKEKR